MLLTAAPAAAHPFGPPPTAVVSAHGQSVFIDWRSAPDDAIAIGVELGLLPPETLEAYLEGPAQVAPSAAKEELLSRSPDLEGYLLGNIAVSQGGSACDGRVQPIGNFVYDGARLVFRCPAPIEVVDLRISMLHDIHEAYRTFAVAADDNQQQAVFTVAQPAQVWDFAAGTAAGGSSGGWLPLVVVAVVGMVGSVFLTARGMRAKARADSRVTR